MNSRDARTRAETVGCLLRSFLASLSDEVLRSGTSELRSWIVAGTAARLAGLAGELVDYQPCYRSEGGTGNAMGFVTWA
jgi:hypothetical protein